MIDFLFPGHLDILNKSLIFFLNRSQSLNPTHEQPLVKIPLRFLSISIKLTLHILLLNRLVNLKPTALIINLRQLKLTHFTYTFLWQVRLQIITITVVWHVTFRKWYEWSWRWTRWVLVLLQLLLTTNPPEKYRLDLGQKYQGDLCFSLSRRCLKMLWIWHSIRPMSCINIL